MRFHPHIYIYFIDKLWVTPITINLSWIPRINSSSRRTMPTTVRPTSTRNEEPMISWRSSVDQRDPNKTAVFNKSKRGTMLHSHHQTHHHQQVHAQRIWLPEGRSWWSLFTHQPTPGFGWVPTNQHRGWFQGSQTQQPLVRYPCQFSYDESEIWYIILSLANALNFLQQNQEEFIDLHPCRILFNE